MAFTTEKELSESLEKNKNKIEEFFSIAYRNYPKEWNGILRNKIKLSTELDKSHFLTHRRGLDRFAVLLTVLEKLNKDIRKIDLFEAGAYSNYSNDGCYTPDIPFFMASGQVSYKYLGFEPENNFTEKTLNQVFSEESNYKITEKINREDFKRNLENNLTKDYELFKGRIIKSKDPLIFSNLVIGCPNINKNFNFWNLPGTHVHSFLVGDLIKFEGQNTEEKKHQRLIEILKKEYEIDEEISTLPDTHLIATIWYKKEKV